MKARFYTLKNGLTVILTVNKKEPRIASIDACSSRQPNSIRRSYRSRSLSEHLMFKGTDNSVAWIGGKEKPLLDSINTLYEKTITPRTRQNVLRFTGH